MNEREKALREFHAQYFNHLRITEDQWKEILSRPPPRLRNGKSRVEIEVRHSKETKWEPLDMPMGRNKSTDNYHPQVGDASTMGGKHSKKGH